jgi:hypothetical protein
LSGLPARNLFPAPVGAGLSSIAPTLDDRSATHDAFPASRHRPGCEVLHQQDVKGAENAILAKHAKFRLSGSMLFPENQPG